MEVKTLEDYKFISKLKSLTFVEEIWLFGSRARGDSQERSDIDLAIICPTANNKDWFKVLDIIDNADTLLKIDCIRFDILQKHDILRDNILKFKKIIYQKANNMEKIFWQDYFITLGEAAKRLAEIVNHPDINKNDFMQDACIQRFECVIELFWKVLKKILSYEKIDAMTPREVINKSYQFKLIDDEDIWLQMLNDRNNTSHIYKQEDARRVFENIKTYLPAIEITYAKLKSKYNF